MAYSELEKSQDELAAAGYCQHGNEPATCPICKEENEENVKDHKLARQMANQKENTIKVLEKKSANLGDNVGQDLKDEIGKARSEQVEYNKIADSNATPEVINTLQGEANWDDARTAIANSISESVGYLKGSGKVIERIQNAAEKAQSLEEFNNMLDRSPSYQAGKEYVEAVKSHGVQSILERYFESKTT